MAEGTATLDSVKPGGGGGGKNIVVLGLLGANLAAVIGLAVFVALSMSGGDGDAAEAAPAAAESGPRDLGPLVEYEAMVVRIATPEGSDERSYFRLSFQIEATDDESAAIVTARMVAIRDAVLTYVSTLTMEQMSGPNPMGEVREHLLESIRGVTGDDAVRAIYFTEFLAQ